MINIISKNRITQPGDNICLLDNQYDQCTAWIIMDIKRNCKWSETKYIFDAHFYMCTDGLGDYGIHPLDVPVVVKPENLPIELYIYG